ncbi:hypothetical protein CTAYLR_006267 [Chrysophaeum taylorii]|uniref:WW domain-containing protein n=1 Tax=Chrysophaeum taylorii TaxID=2483200 RepID=A0AAD7UL25_9STRA|nr:hypothetical protein CTAYLR_006267 [Chrysophaeum taylorii]
MMTTKKQLSVGHACALGALQRRWRERRRQYLLIEYHEFTKYLDPASGQFYYVHRGEGYSTWARPGGGGGGDLPLLQPADAEQERAKKRRAQQSAASHDVVDAKYERRRLVDGARSRRADETVSARAEAARLEEAEYEQAWAEAFRFAAKSGELNLSNKAFFFGRRGIHPYVYSFPERFRGRELIALRLAARGLEELPGRLGKTVTSLTTLALPSNDLTKLPESICSLARLTSLNVLRNRLVELPPKIGDLGKLVDLQIATNRLQTLPPSFGNLTRLDRLVLDCNRLRRLPETLARLACKVVSINSNQLVSLPRCVFQIEVLEFLSANDNKLRQIPNCIGDSRSITRLSLCANEITEIPESVALMTRLRELRLDHNKPLAVLPWNFFLLTSLESLHMEGNTGMMYPTQDKLVQGAAAVREWFRRRQKRALFVREHRIVTAFQDIMEQIVEAKPRVCSPAFFEPDVSKDGASWYAVVADNFWERALPALRETWDENRARAGRATCLPYAREEVEKVLRTYRDAEGCVQIENARTYFRRCACVDARGNRRVCVPPAPGWMCEREATLVKMRVVLQREKIERERRRRERLAVDQAIEEARLAAREFAQSEEGIATFRVQARERARTEMAARRRRRWESDRAAKTTNAARQIRAKFEQRRAALRAQRRQNEEAAYGRLRDDLEPREEALDGYARDKVRAEIDRVIQTIANPPEDALLEALDRELEAALEKSRVATESSSSFFAAGGVNLFHKSSDARELEELTEELEVDLVNRYAAKQVKQAEKLVREEHAKMRKIAASWAGLAARDVFLAWKRHARREKRRREKDRWTSRADELQAAADCAAALELARWNLAKYEKVEDVWTDQIYWTRVDTGVVVWDEPQLDDLLPSTLRIPEGMRTDQAQVDQVLADQAKAVVNPVSDEDLDTPPESESESESEEEEEEGGHGLLVAVDEGEDEETSSMMEPSVEAEEAPALEEWDPAEAYLPGVSETEVEERRRREVEVAQERARARRRRVLEKQRAAAQQGAPPPSALEEEKPKEEEEKDEASAVGPTC